MAQFTLTSGADTVNGANGVADVVRSTVADLSAVDLVNAGNDANVTDRFDFSDAGNISAAALANVTGIEWVRLSANGTEVGGVLNAIQLTDAFVASATGARVRVDGSTGNDVIDGCLVSTGTSALNVFAGTGNDTVLGSAGADTLRGEAGMDMVMAGAGADSVLGGEDSDLISGDFGADTINGDAGDDLIFGGLMYSDCDADGNLIRGGLGNDEMIGGGGADTIMGNEDNDEIYGGAGNDSLLGDAGDDEIIAGEGCDTILGGDGNDTIVFEDAPSLADQINGGNGTDVVVFDFGGAFHMKNVALTSVELIEIGCEALELTLTATKRAVDLGDNSDTMVIGGAGSDTFYVNSEGQSALGFGGNDSFVVDADSTEDMMLTGGAGQDAILFVGGTDCDPIDFDCMVVTGIETIYIDNYSTEIYLDSSIYTVHAGDGGNHIDLGTGRTTEVSSGEGCDYIEVNKSTQVVSAGGGSDVVEIYAAIDSKTVLVGGAGNDTLVVHDTIWNKALTMGSGIRTFEVVVLDDDGWDGDSGVRFTTNNTRNLTVIGSEDDDKVTLRNETQNVDLGCGDDTVVISESNEGTLDGGSDDCGDTVCVVGDEDVVFGNVTNFETVVVADDAHVTLNDGDDGDDDGTDPDGIDYEVILLGGGSSTDDVGASVTGGVGDETYEMRNDYQEVSAGGGDDYIEISSNASNATVDGGTGNDTIDIALCVTLSTLDIDGGDGDDQVNIFLPESGDLLGGAPANFTSIERFQITMDDNGDGHEINATNFTNLTLLTYDGADSAVGANVTNLSGDLDSSDLEGTVYVTVVKDNDTAAGDASNITVGNGTTFIDATGHAPGDVLTVDGGNETVMPCVSINIDHSDVDASGLIGELYIGIGASSDEGVGTTPTEPAVINIATASGNTTLSMTDQLDHIDVNASSLNDGALLTLNGTANQIDVVGLAGDLDATTLTLTNNLTVATVAGCIGDTVSIASDVTTLIDNANMTDGSVLSISGEANFTVTNVTSDVNATNTSGTVDITLSNAPNINITLDGCGSNTIDGDALADNNTVYLLGCGTTSVDLVGGDLGADSFAGNLTVDVAYDANIGATDNRIGMGSGNDSVSFGDGLGSGDTVSGGSGSDTLSFTDNGTGTNDLDNVSGIETILLGNAVTNVTTVDALIASGSTLTVNGSSNTFAITFNAAADTAGNLSISTGGGNDTIWATANGSDTVSTGNGTDEIRFGTGLFSSDSVNGGAGADTLFFTDNGSNNNDLANVVNVEYIMLGNAATNVTTVNTLVANNVILTVDGGNVTAGGILFNGAAEVDGRFAFITGAGSDTITGGSGADTFTATAGDSTVLGGGDQLIGGSGNDSFVMETMLTGADTVTGGSGGGDRLDFTDNGVGTNDLDNVSTIEFIKFGDANTNVVLGNDNLVAGTLTVQINGISVGVGKTITFDGSLETTGQFDFFGGFGADSVIGSNSTFSGDTIDGAGGNDQLTGLAGDDSLIGGTGSNVLIGGVGADTLDGLDGAADVHFRSNDGSSVVYGDGEASLAGVGDVYLLNAADDNFIIDANISDPTEVMNVTTLGSGFDFEDGTVIAQATGTTTGDLVTGDTINASVLGDAADVLLAVGGAGFFTDTGDFGYVLVGDTAVDGQKDWALFYVEDGADSADGALTADEIFLVGVFKDYGTASFDGFFLTAMAT